MSPLFRLFTWRHQRRHLLRAFLGLASVALGVALYVSLEVAQSSTIHAFEQSVRRIAGKAELRVSRGRQAGIEFEALERIEQVVGVAAAPALQRSTTFLDLPSGPVMVLGVDFRRELKFRDYSLGKLQINPFLLNEEGLLITRRFGTRHGLAIGRILQMRTPTGLRPVRIAGLLDDTGPAEVFDGNLAVMDVRGAQKLFATGGRVDRIDVLPASAAEAIRAKLGPDYAVDPVQARSSVMEEVLTRIRSLVVVSMISLMVGLFIIYLSVSIGVVERTKEIGILRALGGSRAQILALFLGEAGVLGLVGSGIGVALGYGLARTLVGYTAENINLMSLQVHVREMILPGWQVAAAVATGTLTSMLAALVPGLRATGISPIEALRPAGFVRSQGRGHGLAFLLGALLFAGSTLGVVVLHSRLSTEWGMLLTAALPLGMALMLPRVTVWVSRLLRRPLRAVFRIEGYLAADNVMKYPQRTSLTVVALSGALSIMVTSASVLLSFERSATTWMETSFPWDLSVQASDLNEGFASDARLPAEVFERVRTAEGVASAFPMQSVLQEVGARDVLLLAADMKGYMQMIKKAGLEEEGFRLEAPAIQEVVRGEGVGVSSNLLQLQGLRVGDRIELRTPRGLRSFKVSYHRVDLSWPQGVIILDLAAYRESWNDSSLRYIDLLVEPGRNHGDVKAALAKALEGEYRAFVYSSAQIQGIARGMLDQSFRLTHVQVIIAMVIGFMGIVNTLLISVLQRTREIGLLRAVGMTRAQVARTVVIESVLIGFVGGLLGVAAGLFGAAFPISLHVLRTTGYELPFAVPWTSMAVALAASLALGFAASYLPARRAAGLNLLEAIGYE